MAGEYVAEEVIEEAPSQAGDVDMADGGEEAQTNGGDSLPFAEGVCDDDRLICSWIHVSFLFTFSFFSN